MIVFDRLQLKQHLTLDVHIGENRKMPQTVNNNDNSFNTTDSFNNNIKCYNNNDKSFDTNSFNTTTFHYTAVDDRSENTGVAISIRATGAPSRHLSPADRHYRSMASGN